MLFQFYAHKTGTQNNCKMARHHCCSHRNVILQNCTLVFLKTILTVQLALSFCALKQLIAVRFLYRKCFSIISAVVALRFWSYGSHFKYCWYLFSSVSDLMKGGEITELASHQSDLEVNHRRLHHCSQTTPSYRLDKQPVEMDRLIDGPE